MAEDEIQKKLNSVTAAIEGLTHLASIQGKSISELRDVLGDLSKLRDRNAQDIAALTYENREVNEDIRVLLKEIREERAKQ